MIIRVVKIPIKDASINSFIKRIPIISNEVRRVSGCIHNDIFRDKMKENIFYSYTIWNSDEDIEKYLGSQYYKDIWGDLWDYFEGTPKSWKIDNIFDYPSEESFN